MSNIQNKVIHRFIRPISDYEEGGMYSSNIIPIDTQAYAYYPNEEGVEKSGLYFVFGDGQHTYVEIRDGEGVTPSAKEYSAACNGVTEIDLEDAIKDMVTWSNHPELEENTRRTIVLKNNDSIVGTAKDNVEYNLAMVSKWDVSDFGSSGLHTNLNTKDTVTINDTQVVATESVVDSKITNALKDFDLTEYAKESDVTSKISVHNTDISAHADIRARIDTGFADIEKKADLVTISEDKTEVGRLAVIDENGQYQASELPESLVKTVAEDAANTKDLNTFSERNTFKKNVYISIDDPTTSDESGIVLGDNSAIVNENRVILRNEVDSSGNQTTYLGGNNLTLNTYAENINIMRKDNNGNQLNCINIDDKNIVDYVDTSNLAKLNAFNTFTGSNTFRGQTRIIQTPGDTGPADFQVANGAATFYNADIKLVQGSAIKNNAGWAVLDLQKEYVDENDETGIETLALRDKKIFLEGKDEIRLSSDKPIVIERTSNNSAEEFINVDSSNIGSYIPAEYITKSVLDTELEAIENKLGTKWGDITGTLSDQTDLSNELQNIREVAQGKTNTYVVNYENNPVFNSQEDSIELTGNFVDVNGTTHVLSELKLGDNVYVQELDVPDRWCANIEETKVTLYKLETSKVVIPTKVSELENDSNYVDATTLANAVNPINTSVTAISTKVEALEARPAVIIRRW